MRTTIEMAREAAGDDWGLFQEYMPEIHRLVELVRADERARLAEQPAQQEPVAWICEGSSSDEKHAIDYWPGDIEDIPIGTKLYTTPPAQRKPLTDEQIEAIHQSTWIQSTATLNDFARAIEAAHGIKENT